MESLHNLNSAAGKGGKKPTRVLQEPLTFIILVWSLMLALVGICFAFTD